MTRADASPPGALRSRVTIKDVARAAGVSVTTASVVLNGRPTAIPVSAETRRRVLAASAEMDYRPNSFARGPRTGRSRTPGLLVTMITDPFTGEVTQAMDLVARERGYRCRGYLRHPAEDPGTLAAAVPEPVRRWRR